MNEIEHTIDRHPILSIIVPVYNVEKYLVECLNSLINQDASKDQYEIICIDDGSPDNCGTILDKYKVNNPSIIVIHQDNAGHAMARNAGLAVASGEYIWFIDSDDFIPKYAVSKIIQSINKQSADILWIGMYHFFGNSVKYDDSDIEKYDSNIKLRSCYSVKSIRKRNFLSNNGILFFDYNVPTMAGDYLMHYKVMKSKPKEGIVTEKPLYFYRYVNNSTSNTLSTKSLITRVNVWTYILTIQKGYFDKEKKTERIKTAIDMQDSVKGIFHWLSLLENDHIDCFTESFINSYLPYIVSINPLFILIDLKAFLYRRIVNSYNSGKKKLFNLHISIRELRIIKKAKKQIRKILKK